jgi:hypothetical protein
MADLIATKSLVYATRRLLPDDAFQAKPRDARILCAIGKARYAVAASEASQTHPAVDDITALRAEYAAVFGKRPFMGWDAATLRVKLAAHQG